MCDVSVPGERSATGGALLLPRLAGWTIERRAAGANPTAPATVSYLGRATVSDCRT